MTFVEKLIIGGWASAFAMFGLFALNASGKLLAIRKRTALWLETLAAIIHTPEEGGEPEGEQAA